MKLLKDVLFVVFSFTGHTSFNKCRRVCQQWKQIIDSADFRAFYANSQAHNFSEYTISMFDESDYELNMPAKFVSMENYRDGFVATTKNSETFQFYKDDLPQELLEHEFRAETEKLCLSYSIHGNQNNWNMTLSNASIPSSTSLDKYFPAKLTHPLPRSLTPDAYTAMIEQRDLFYSELCRTQKYGIILQASG